MKQTMRGIGVVVYAVTLIAVIIIDLVIQVALFANGNIGAALLYLVFGWAITLSIGHVVALLLAAPFALAGGED